MKYEPVFKMSRSNVIVTDVYTRSYMKYGSIVTIKNGKWETFLSEESLKKCSEEGYLFALDKNKYKEFENKYPFFKEKFRKLKEINIEQLNKEEFLEFLEEVEKLFVYFYDTYRETEFFYFTKLEKELKSYIQKENKFSLQELLSNKVDLALLPEKMRKLADYIINMQHLKFEYRKILNEVALGENVFLWKLLRQLVTRTNREDAVSMTLKEFKNVLNGEKMKDVSERHVYSFITWDKEKKELNILSGSEAYKKIRELDKDLPKNEVIGECACSGIARGRVRIVANLRHLLKFKKGEILVAGTTGPEKVVAIEKAAAIVTEEGGMMSHAAIISREFDIPCVVGTKYATKVFKDGDFIEVNANNGVVRKIDDL